MSTRPLTQLERTNDDAADEVAAENAPGVAADAPKVSPSESSVASRARALEGRRVLFVSYNGMLDPLGQSQVLPYLRALWTSAACASRS